MTEMLTDRYEERLAGVLSCYDRIMITGEPLAKLAIQPNFSVQAGLSMGWQAAISGMIGASKP